MKKVDANQIKKIASLAKLSLSSDELSKYEKEFNSILEYVSQIEKSDLGDSKFSHNLENYTGAIFQKDEVDPSPVSSSLILNVATDRVKNGYVKTSKIVNKD